MSSRQLFKWTYPKNTGSGFTIIPKSLTVNRDIEEYFTQLASKFETFDVKINHNLPHLLHGYLKGRLHKVQRLQLRLIHRYMNDIERLYMLSIDASNGPLNEMLRNELQLQLDDAINDLIQNLKDLESKSQLISFLEKQNFQYYDVAQCNLDQIDSIQTLERILIKDNPNIRILCSNDTLNNNNQSKFHDLYEQLALERKTNQNLSLIYADCSNCSLKLREMIILPSNKNLHSEDTLSISLASLSDDNDDDIINILLLGETGVGKSTFINAFVNYLTFDTLEKAESNQPAVFIPISFLMTTGDNFQENIVKFGDFDSPHNEDFNHPGQSVTQYCQSYMFDLNHINGKKLRIIDTPGFGDTRGLDQDDMNMQHILEYISDFTHLNAICFLLKPNVSELNIFFRTCLTQLVELLGSNASENMIFCFTNARSTFYTPGNTAPLLQTMLDSVSIKNIPFKKENTFCFDSESFRYLVALQNGIQFSVEEKQEYEMSWSTSAKESQRLISYINTQRITYPLHNEQSSSVNHTQIEITHMIRPILEAMRNILRNMILWKMDSSNRSIQLCPKAIQRPSAFCVSCKRDSFQLGKFWILPDDAHEFGKECLVCSCPPDQHFLVDYIISYNILNNSSNHQQNQMNDLLNQLCIASTEFAYFLMNITRSTEKDPFLNDLMRIIHEEKQICAKQKSNHFNLQLVKELENLIVTYEEQMKRLQLNQKTIDLKIIDEKIKTVCEYPMVREQIAAIYQKTEGHIDEQHDGQVFEY